MRVLTLFFLLNCFDAIAQHDHSATSSASNHLNHILASRKETKYINNLPAPVLSNGIGKSDLMIQTTSDSAQKYFSQGIALLHCFWDFEAYRAFREAIRHDSAAIMPYWGIVETIGHFRNEGFTADKAMALKKLKSLKFKANEHERLYVDGILLADSLKDEGEKAYDKKLETIVDKYPKDTDAKLILALRKMGGYDHEMNLNEGQLYSEYLLLDVLKTNPKHHAVQHYWIHLKENCCPEQAEEAADVLASLAPESGHIVHMPGHIYYKLGHFKKAHDAFVASLKVDSLYMKKQGILELDTWNYLHNISYLLASCSEDGRYREGLYYAEKIRNIPLDTARRAEYNGTFFHFGILAPAEMEMRYGFWDNALKALEGIQNPDSIFGKKEINERDALILYAGAMGALQKNDISAARARSVELDAFLYRNANDTDKEAVFSKRAADYFNTMSSQVRGLLLAAEGKYADAVALLEDTQKKELKLGYSEPPVFPSPLWLSLANTHIREKKYDKALEAYEKMLKQRPGNARTYYGMANVYRLMGDRAKAAEFDLKFQEATKYGDPSVYKKTPLVGNPWGQR